MKSFLTIIMLICIIQVFSQENDIEYLTNIKEKLVIEKEFLSDSIEKIDIKINYLKSKNNNIDTHNFDYTLTTTKSNAKIKNQPDLFGDIIGYIQTGESLKVYDYFDEYWLVEKDSLKGYTSDLYLIKNEKMQNLKKKHKKEEIIKKYGKITANRIFNHEIWLGMTSKITVLSIGSPKEINRTTGTWGVHEQWIYKNKYLYFEDGKLTSWQD